MLRDLVEALIIFLKYGNPKYPVVCEDGKLAVVGIDPERVLDSDIERLDDLGFVVDDGRFRSTRLGTE